MATVRLFAIACLALTAACTDSTPAPPASSAAPSASHPPAATEPRSNGARALALAKPGASTPIDKEIEALQKQANTLNKTDVWVSLGRAWVRKARESADPGYYLHANACAEVAFEVEPENRLAMNLRGLVLLNNHQFGEARDVAEQILLKDPDDPMAHGTLSDALLEMGRFDEAVKAAQKMVDIKPNLPSYARAAHLRWLQGDVAAAKQIIRRAIDASDPNDPEPRAWVLVQAAMIFWHEGDHAGAAAGFDKALGVFSDYPPALVGHARAAMAAGDPRRAVELLEKAYRLSPLVETAWLLGDAREALGDARGAQDAYDLVVKHGRMTDGRTLAMFYATKNRDQDEALRLVKAELSRREDSYTQDTCAWALYRLGRLEEARAASDKAVALGTRDASLLYHAGAIRMAMNDRAGGEKLVREALKLNPHFDRTAVAEAAKLLQASAGAASGSKPVPSRPAKGSNG
jgi:tetratricopeptide (TPR) repeat protein